MNPLFILNHSPLVGPLTWSRVADELKRRGFETLVPRLNDGKDSDIPYWQQHANGAARGLSTVPPSRPLLHVAHSGAGPLLPAIAWQCARPVTAYVFVDAGIPRNGASHLDLMSSESLERAEKFRQFLGSGGRFPDWSEADLRDEIPDTAMRRALLAELHPQSLAFWEEPIPVWRGWPDAPCAYLQFSPTYDAPAQYARQRGWAFQKIDGGHFHMLNDPITVTDALLDLVNASQK